MAPSKITTLSLKATTGTIVGNADNTHEASVLHVVPTDKVASGQLSLLIPKGADGEQGLEPGEYSISLSLIKSASVPADGNTAMIDKDAFKEPARTRASDRS